ncbi:hypothetical protein [Pusillimonas sp. ANT_WB101]|uniref:hypothetical protein n=1 Tax=Pusillimonas sp. ANT_WB101 TaxID=2597356 RepID=UPI00165D92CE|nr:hypothetical protein [Pusillimonas sp. ANT_WB101]
MAKYQVTRPWHGVKMGQIVDLKQVHPALRANVMLVGEGVSDKDQASSIIAQAQASAETLRKDTEMELSKQIEAAIDGARGEAKAIVEAATAEAQRIVDDANKRAAEIVPMVEGKGPELTPATPDATTDKVKATKAK